MVKWLLVLAACKPHEVEQKPFDAGRPIDAAPIDAVVIDAFVKVAPPATAVALADGDAACAVMSDATVRCADGTPAVASVKSLATAGGSACALLDDGSVSCWGKLGWSHRAADRPTGVLGVVGVTKLWVRPGLGCGQVANGSLICWGAIDPQGHPAASGMRQPTPAVDVVCDPPPKPSKKKPKKPPPPPPPPKECGTALDYIERVPVPPPRCTLSAGTLHC